MATRFFHRHTRKCLDAAVRRVLSSLSSRPAMRDAFVRLATVVHARSDLLRTPPVRGGALPHLDALVHLATWHRQMHDPYAWEGASGHPLAVVHSLAGHLLGYHPTPRFLASVWFGGATPDERTRRGWFVQHARGRPFRSLDLPLAMTRRMEHAFLCSPDHLGVDRALRRAEVLGLGGSPELAEAVLATRLGTSWDGADERRAIIAWLVRWRDELELRQVAPIVSYLHPARPTQPLTERTLTALWRDASTWRAPAPRRPASPWLSRARELSWPRSAWSELVIDGTGPGVTWRLVELLDGDQLAGEGRAMHHCVGTYVWGCAHGDSTIWSLRRHEGDGDGQPVLTIEVSRRSRAVVQLRASHNRPAAGLPLSIVRAWAARERLAFTDAVEQHIARGAPAAANPPDAGEAPALVPTAGRDC